jgi:hypothetical protein
MLQAEASKTGAGESRTEERVPLSEHEQRQLEAIERALYADDPKFAHTVRFSDPRSHGRRRLALGISLVVVGLGVLLGGAVVTNPYIGVGGFLIMLVGATRAYSGAKRLAGRGGSSVRPKPGPDELLSNRGPLGRSKPARPDRRRRAHPQRKNSGGSFVERFEERWRRRFDEP